MRFISVRLSAIILVWAIIRPLIPKILPTNCLVLYNLLICTFLNHSSRNRKYAKIFWYNIWRAQTQRGSSAMLITCIWLPLGLSSPYNVIILIWHIIWFKCLKFLLYYHPQFKRHPISYRYVYYRAYFLPTKF